jgi:GrpB-like predicted nucleotidyltransferase (UPF0157 family)
MALIAERLPATAVEHVGSSAVPGCAGKGYLGFAIAYRDAAHLDEINGALFALGFGRQRNRDPFPETRPMRTGAFVLAGGTFLLHVHVVPAASGELADLCAFRDRLRGDPALVSAYVASKQGILDAGVRDSVDYALAKGAFIEALRVCGVADA